MAYEMVKDYVAGKGGELEWEKGGAYGGKWRLELEGKTVRFHYRGWCPLDTLKESKVPNPRVSGDYHLRLREDAFWKLVEIFDRDDVIKDDQK